MKYCLTYILTFFSLIATAQMHTVSGVVTDDTSGEVLIGATILEVESGRGYATNEYGFFSFKALTDSVWLKISYIGYHPYNIKLSSNSNQARIKLKPISTEIEEVVVSHHSKSRVRNHGQFSISKLDLRNTPVMMAEKDVLKTIQLLPGVQQNSEGMSNFSVRGGNHDQNLMLIDGIPVYNINHLWGFVSVFNTDAVNSVNFFKGGIPASYGGRLSSVVDVMLREGNNERYTGSVSIGLISSRFTAEGPIQKGKSSFLVSGRRTFYDLIVSPILYLVDKQMPGYYFQDYTLKLNHKVNSHNTIYLSSYIGNDKAYVLTNENLNDNTKLSDRTNLGWANVTTALRWNNTSLPNLFSNVTLAYTHFKYLTSKKSKLTNAAGVLKEMDYHGYYSGINDIITKWSLSYYGFKWFRINAGVDHSLHMFNPGITNNVFTSETEEEEEYDLIKGENIIGSEFNAYIDTKFKIGKFSGNFGVRHSWFLVDQEVYAGFQPRGSIEISATNRISLFAGYNRMFQFTHLVSNSNLGMPTDLWLPISKEIPPQKADQISIGITFKIKNSTQLTIEAYKKNMENLTEYRDGVILRNKTSDWDRILTLGKGESKGVEFMLEGSLHRLSGWISYSLSKSNRTFGDINTGKPFPFQYDRRHSGNIFLSYKISAMQSLSLSWVACSGHRLTINHDNYLLNGQVVLNLSERNNYQLPAYHHLDVTYTSMKKKKRGTRSWIFGIYNVYARQNPFMITRRNPETGDFAPDNLYTISLFPFIPFVAWEYYFN